MLDNGTFVVSYADTAWSHVGYVYQACNFLYTGLSAKRVDFYMPDGKHPRSACRDGQNEVALHQTRSRKHRYVYLVGDRRTKKHMRKELKYKVIEKYPKGDETHYDTDNPQRIIPIEVIQTKSDMEKNTINRKEQHMIWFYLAGFISGVIGMLLLGKHISDKEKEKGNG